MSSEPRPPREHDYAPLDDGVELVDAMLGFRAALTAHTSTELSSLAEFVE